MKVGLSGTFDIDNYGDILFPLVVSQVLSDLEIVPLSPTEGKPNFDDSYITNKISTKYDSNLSALIIGGGNIIRTTSSYLDKYVEMNVENTSYLNLWLSLTLSNINNMAPIVWNCPGVAEVLDEKLNVIIKKALERTNYISVRDQQSKDILLNISSDLNISVVPDSVWSISEIVPKGLLEKDFIHVMEDDKCLKKQYIVFHFNDRYLNDNNAETLVELIKKIVIKFNAIPILLSLGNCHNDSDLIEKISNGLDIEHKCIARPSSLVQCLSILAYSKAYFGSSMHGFITASSYGNTAICIAEDKIKFDGIQDLFLNTKVYVNSWSELISLIDNIDLISRSYSAIKVKTNAINKLNVHWHKIKEILSGCEKNHEINFKDLDSWNLIISSIKIESLEKRLTDLNSRNRKIERELNKTKLDVVAYRAKLSLLHIRVSDKLVNRILAIPYSKQVLRRLKKTYSSIVDNYRNLKFKYIDTGTWNISEKAIDEVKNYDINKKSRKIAVVTALYGGYDNLMLPLNICDDFDYFCFTDRQQDTFGVWKLCSAPYYNEDTTRVARFVKTHLNELFPNYDYVIWVDGNVRFNHKIENILEDFIKSNKDICLIKHPIRNCVYEEANKCIDLNKDSPDLIEMQAQFYRKSGFPENYGMYETNVYIINNRSDKIDKFYSIWWSEIKLRSRRDQMSITYSLKNSGLTVEHLLTYGKSVREDENFQIFHHQKSRYLKSPKVLESVRENKIPDFSYINKIGKIVNLDSYIFDIIICVYNALDDVKLCIDSVMKEIDGVNKIIIVNDYSNQETTDYLNSISDFDKIETKNWVRKLKQAAFSSDKVGIVGPISNAASNQSVPNVGGTKGQTAINTLPVGYTPEMMNDIAETFTPLIYPIVPLIHGFCIGIKSTVIDKIGYFDDVNFSRYYGEENDYCLRAHLAGFEHIISIDTFIFHSKSKSIEEEERIIHMDKAGKKLREIYGYDEVKSYVLQVERNPILINLRKYYDDKIK
jgi:O-antigen biosynthesis protein